MNVLHRGDRAVACAALPRPRPNRPGYPGAPRRKGPSAPDFSRRSEPPRESSGPDNSMPDGRPQCQHFGICGGCTHLDMAIQEQLDDKLHDVTLLLQPFLGAHRIVTELPRRTPVHFRTKLLYPVRSDGKGRCSLGIYKPMSHDVVRIKECRTQDEGLTELGLRAETILRQMELEAWDETTQKGFVQAFGARSMPGTGELLIGVVTRKGVFPKAKQLADRLMEAAQGLPRSGRTHLHPVGVVRSINERTGNYLLGDKNVPLLGRDYQMDKVDGLDFRVRFGSFYQVHRDSHSLLYRPTMELCGDVTGQRVVDGYGGVGTFGLRLAKAGAKRVEIVEANPVACGDAEQNAKQNGFADRVVVEQLPFAQAKFAAEPDLLLVDPPRSGLQADGVARVLAAKPKRLVMVHCSAESLARDLEGLGAGGWKVQSMRLCDMFPHTAHVERVTKMVRG